MKYCPACAALLDRPRPTTCEACGAVHYRNAKPCAGVLITREGHLLLLRRAMEPWFGDWDIPGGFCEATEHPAEAARREAREETGLDVEITAFLGMWLDTYPDPVDGEAITLNCYFTADVPVGTEPEPNPTEASGHAWFAPDTLPERIAFPAHAAAVLAAWREALRRG